MEETTREIIKAGLRAHLQARISKGVVDKEINNFIQMIESRTGFETISFTFPIVVDTAFIELVEGLIAAVRKFDRLT